MSVFDFESDDEAGGGGGELELVAHQEIKVELDKKFARATHKLDRNHRTDTNAASGLYIHSSIDGDLICFKGGYKKYTINLDGLNLKILDQDLQRGESCKRAGANAHMPRVSRPLRPCACGSASTRWSQAC